MSITVSKDKIDLYKKPLEKIFGEGTFELELEDYEQSKFLVIKKEVGDKIAEPCLFVSINKVTGVARGFTSNAAYKKHADQIKQVVEKAYQKEKNQNDL